LWWLVLFGLWNVVQAAAEAMEIAAGAGAAAVGATLAELTRRQGLLGFAPELRSIATAALVPWRALREFAVITSSLALDMLRVRRIRGAWVAVPFAAGGSDPVSAGNRAVRPLVDNVTPNTLVADVDIERGVALKHDLVPSRASKPVP
jgi:hypothetical protein